jgi:peptide-methionine (S)-S-oxide reductase
MRSLLAPLLIQLGTAAALVDYSALSGLPQSLAQHAASYAYCSVALPERYDDDTSCDLLEPSALQSTTAMMQMFSGQDARFATFAGGCFWGLELAYQRLLGVLCTAVGYTQGNAEFPSYGEVCSEATGHAEAVLLLYDKSAVSYAELAELFFDRVGDPTMLNRVGNDRGTQYRTGLYFHSDEQEAEAREAFGREAQSWASSGRDVVTEVLPASVFWPAEEVHQRFLAKGNGRSGKPQSPEKGATEIIRCYG